MDGGDAYVGSLLRYFRPGKEIYSGCFEKYRLDQEALESLQKRLLRIFSDIKNLCDENGIGYMMHAGTLLGTVRHQGFIPWDDDIDILMLREDYEKFRTVFRAANKAGALTDYILAEPYETPGFFFKIPKIYDRNTRFLSVNYMGNPDYNMVGVDIFIVESVPASRFVRTFRYGIYRFAFYASALCMDYMYPSPVIIKEGRSNRELGRYYDFRRLLGAMFSRLGGIRFYLGICRRMERYSGKRTLRGFPSDPVVKKVYDLSMFTRTAEGMFCGLEVKIPADYDSFLQDQYGDYMKIPPENEREIHVAYEMEL